MKIPSPLSVDQQHDLLDNLEARAQHLAGEEDSVLKLMVDKLRGSFVPRPIKILHVLPDHHPSRGYMYRGSFLHLAKDWTADDLTLNESFVQTARQLQVVCPKCKVNALAWCITNHGNPYEGLHAARRQEAERLGWLTGGGAMPLPDVYSWEVRGA